MRKGAAKIGIFLILAAIVVFTVHSLQPADAVPGPGFDFYGYVQYPNGSFINATNVTITVTDTTMGPETVIGIFDNLTDSNGFFNLTNITNDDQYSYKLKIKHYLEGSNEIVTWVGPELPHLPAELFMNDTFGLNNASIILQRGANLNLSVVNSSGGLINFTYDLIDKKLGYPIEFGNASEYVYGKIVHVPYNRNYTVQFNPFFSPPLEVTINNVSAHNSSPDCFANDTCTYIAPVRANGTFDTVNVHGYINTTDFGVWGDNSSNLTNLSIVTYMVFGGEDIFHRGTIPNHIGTFFGGQPDAINGSTDNGAFYNITLVGTTTGFEVLMIFHGVGNATWNPNVTSNYYYGAFQNFTTFFNDPDEEVNITLGRYAGATGTQTIQGFDSNTIVVTNLTTINLTAPNASQPVGQAFMEARLSYHNPTLPSTGREYRWFLETDSQTSNTIMSLPNITSDLEFRVYSQNYAPLKKKINNSLINTNTTLVIELYAMDIHGPDGEEGGGEHNSEVHIDFYRSSGTCDVPNPDTACELTSFEDAESFNPLKALLGGETSMRMTHSTNVTVHYVNVDMLASGPPDAVMDTDADTSDSSNNVLSEAWRFGSQGPDVYDYILIGIPYNDSDGGINDSADVNFSIPYFYDDDWNVIWNTSANGTNATHLAENFTDYAGDESDWQFLMSQSTCVTNTTNFTNMNPCYINATGNMVWIRIPHFSGTGPEISGAVLPATESSSDDSSSSSSGGGGGGGGATPTQNTKVTTTWTSLTDGQAVSIEVSKTGIPVTDIDFTVDGDVAGSGIAFTVEVLTEKPETLPDVEDPYQFMEITAANFDVTAATITFDVNASWLVGKDKNALSLRRYTTQWDELDTVIVAENAGVVTYEATTPGFSTFVIAIDGDDAPPGPVCGDDICEDGEDCAEDCDAAEPFCTPGVRECQGSSLVECNADGTAFVGVMTCDHGCANAACAAPTEIPVTQNPQTFWMIIVLGVVVLGVLLFVYTRKKK